MDSPANASFRLCSVFEPFSLLMTSPRGVGLGGQCGAAWGRGRQKRKRLWLRRFGHLSRRLLTHGTAMGLQAVAKPASKRRCLARLVSTARTPAVATLRA